MGLSRVPDSVALLGLLGCVHPSEATAPSLPLACTDMAVPAWVHSEDLAAACSEANALRTLPVREGVLTVPLDADIWRRFSLFLVDARPELAEGIPIVFIATGGGRWALLAQVGEYHSRVSEIAEKTNLDLQAGTVTETWGSPIGTLVAGATWSAPASPPLMMEWAYARAIARTGRDPYAAVDWDADVPTGLEWTALSAILRGVDGYSATLDAFLSSTAAPLYNGDWARAIDALINRGAVSDARKVYRRFRPLGSCSMDSRPQDATYRFARFCADTGDMPCLIDLQQTLMADAVARYVWSSFAQTARATAVELLDDTGVDVVRYLMGLALVFQDTPAWSEWRLAKAMVDSPHRDEAMGRLTSILRDGELDPLNEMRLASVLTYSECLSSVAAPSSPTMALRPATVERVHTVSRVCAEVLR